MGACALFLIREVPLCTRVSYVRSTPVHQRRVDSLQSCTKFRVNFPSKERGNHERPFEVGPRIALGAVKSFLEPFGGHLSPTVDNSLKNQGVIDVRKALRDTSAGLRHL